MEPNLKPREAAPTTALPYANYGIIRITHRLMHAWGLNMEQVTTQGELRQEGFFDTLAEHLQLPKSYSYAGIFFMPYQRNMEVSVTSLELPLVQPYQRADLCKPEYIIGEDRHGEPIYAYVRMVLQRDRPNGLLQALDFTDLYRGIPADYPL